MIRRYGLFYLVTFLLLVVEESVGTVFYPLGSTWRLSLIWLAWVYFYKGESVAFSQIIVTAVSKELLGNLAVGLYLLAYSAFYSTSVLGSFLTGRGSQGKWVVFPVTFLVFSLTLAWGLSPHWQLGPILRETVVNSLCFWGFSWLGSRWLRKVNPERYLQLRLPDNA